MARIDPDTNPVLYQPLAASQAILPLLPEDELETPPLPREHPKWVQDGLAVSQRAKQLVGRLKPVVVRIVKFWDHHVRAIAIGGGKLTVDSSGSYYFE